jgi:hypothetical protein
MGDPAEPTPSDRQQIRDRARAILAAVTNDESVARAAGLVLYPMSYMPGASKMADENDVEDLLVQLAQEVEALQSALTAVAAIAHDALNCVDDDMLPRRDRRERHRQIDSLCPPHITGSPP